MQKWLDSHGVLARGEHGQDQDWISCRILAIFSDQDWIWIFIFEKNWIRTGSGYLFDFCNKIFLRVIQDVTNDRGDVFFAMVFILSCQYVLHSPQSMVICVTSSLIFSGQVEVVSCSYIAVCCFVCCAEWHVCVVEANGLFHRWSTCLRLGSTRRFLDNSRSTGRQ